MEIRPKISIVIPYHDMDNAGFFLKRNIDSIMSQTFKDYEIVLTKSGKMAPNTNEGIKRSRGEIIKIIYLDDYLGHKDALKEIVEAFKGGWLVTGCEHDMGNGIRSNPHLAQFNIDDEDNFIGSPSVLAFENKEPLLFDEEMTWLLDFDLYKRLYARYGPPQILDTMNVVIGIHSGQVTNHLSDEVKLKEREYLNKKNE